ncbi:MAG: hypothetical protein QM679_01295 [Patulibacter sp.]
MLAVAYAVGGDRSDHRVGELLEAVSVGYASDAPQHVDPSHP